MKKNKKIRLIGFFIILMFSVILTGCSERLTGLNYTIVYESLGGTLIPEYSGNLINTMPIPTKDGYTFEGWYEDKDFSGKRVNFPYIIYKDVILYAKYIDNSVGNPELVYNMVDSAFEVTEYNGDSYIIYIPEKHNGLPVIRLCENFIKNFYNTTVLYISKNVSEINEKLYFNKRLSAIEVNGNNQTFSSQDGVLYNKDRSKLICYPSGRRDKEFTVAAETVEITRYALRNNIYLEKIAISKAVTIYDKGIYDLISLKEVSVDKENTALCDEDGVLYDKNIEKLLFFPPKYKDKQYNIPDSVKIIDEHAFFNCAIENIKIGVSLEAAPLFESCKQLKSIEVDDRNAIFKSIDGVLFDKSGRTLLRFPASKIVEEGNYYLPSGTKRIAPFAFSNMKNVRSIYLNGEISSIGSFAFTGENSVEKIIAESEIILQVIENGAFSGCTALTEFRLFCRVPPAITEGEFENCPFGLKIFVPENMRGLYEAIWSNHSDKLANGQPLSDFTVNFNTQGGVFVGSVTAGYILEEPVTEKNGYTFLGWYDNAEGTGERYNFPMAIKENITLYASWELILN